MIRPARPDEAPAPSDLALRSQGVWGYSPAVLEACREELTIHPDDGDGERLLLAEEAHTVPGFALLHGDTPAAELAYLYVAPDAIGCGVGRSLLDAAIAAARRLGITRLTIEADPHAKGFYRRAGAVRIGAIPSGSIASRQLPLLALAIPPHQP